VCFPENALVFGQKEVQRWLYPASCKSGSAGSQAMAWTPFVPEQKTNESLIPERISLVFSAIVTELPIGPVLLNSAF